MDGLSNRPDPTEAKTNKLKYRSEEAIQNTTQK